MLGNKARKKRPNRTVFTHVHKFPFPSTRTCDMKQKFEHAIKLVGFKHKGFLQSWPLPRSWRCFWQCLANCCFTIEWFLLSNNYWTKPFLKQNRLLGIVSETRTQTYDSKLFHREKWLICCILELQIKTSPFHGDSPQMNSRNKTYFKAGGATTKKINDAHPSTCCHWMARIAAALGVVKTQWPWNHVWSHIFDQYCAVLPNMFGHLWALLWIFVNHFQTLLGCFVSWVFVGIAQEHCKRSLGILGIVLRHVVN